jgi:hypothetical protein
MLTPSSSIASHDSPLRTASDNFSSQEEETCEDSEEDDKLYVSVPMFSQLLRANDDLSRKQGKAPIVKPHDEGSYTSKISIGERHQTSIPDLILVRRKSDFRRDMEKSGTRIWMPQQLEDKVIEEYEEFCKEVVRSRLPICHDERYRNERYMHDKALEILHDTDFNVAKAKEIVAQSPELITKKELCNTREAAKLQRGFETYGKNFAAIRHNMLYDETISKEDMVNYYYLFKKRRNLTSSSPSHDLRMPIIYQEDDEDDEDDVRDDESEDSEDLAENVQESYFGMDYGQEHSLDLITPPPSPLSPHHMYHQLHSYDSIGTFGAEEETSLSCDDFLIPIECSSGSEPRFDDDSSPVNFSTYESPSGNMKIDDLFSLSNTL